MSTITKSRQIEQLYRGQETSDGAGVKLTRLLSNNLQRRLDPFLMLDCFGSDNPDDYIAGFPNHPHRGFETVTYMIEGRMLLRVMRGFQLWLNLAAQDKMIKPWYKDYQNPDLPKYTTDEGVQVTIIAGSSNGVEGAVQREHTEPLYLDVHLPAGKPFETAIPTTHNAFIVVYEGQLEVNGKVVQATQLALLANTPEADGLSLIASEDSKAIIVAGKPLNEPIVQHGPFVMNSREEIMEAFNDFQAGKFA